MTEQINESIEVKMARLEEKVNFIIKRFDDLDSKTLTRIESLESSKVDRKEFESLQQTINNSVVSDVEKLKLWRSGIIVGIIIIGAITGWLVPQLTDHLKEDSGHQTDFLNLKTQVDNYISTHK
jgi:hypothetical protein